MPQDLLTHLVAVLQTCLRLQVSPQVLLPQVPLPQVLPQRRLDLSVVRQAVSRVVSRVDSPAV